MRLFIVLAVCCYFFTGILIAQESPSPDSVNTRIQDASATGISDASEESKLKPVTKLLVTV